MFTALVQRGDSRYGLITSAARQTFAASHGLETYYLHECGMHLIPFLRHEKVGTNCSTSWKILHKRMARGGATRAACRAGA